MTTDAPWNAWTEVEDTTLRTMADNAKDRFGEVVWTLVPVLPNRTLSGMKKRYYNLAKGLVTSGPNRHIGPWKPEEDAALLTAIATLRIGRKIDWPAVVAALPHRSLQNLSGRYYSLLKIASNRRGKPSRDYSPPRPERVPEGCERPCITCRQPFRSPDRRRVWMCENCKKPSHNSYVKGGGL